MKFRTFLLYVAFNAIPAFAFSQVAIHGKVVDGKLNPVSYANVILLDQKDSAMLAGAVTDDNGSFEIRAEKNAILRVSHIGFMNKYVKGITSGIREIIMQPDTCLLKEVVAKGNLPQTRLKGDAIVTTVSGSYLSRAGTANDVLVRLPGVIKKDGDIEVIGKGTPLIYINGRKIRNKLELDQLSSDEIRNVEVLMNPGAGYDATANSIIRITTVRPAGEGLGINNRVLFGVDRYFYGLDELNFNYRSKKYDVFGMLEYDNDRDYTVNTIIQSTFRSPYILQKSLMTEKDRNRIYDGKVGFDYNFSDRHSVGAFYEISHKPTRESADIRTLLFTDSTLDNTMTATQSARLRKTQHLLNGYYDGKLGDWKLNFNIDALWYSNNSNVLVKEISTDADNRIVTTTNDNSSRLLAEKIQASHSLWKGLLTVGNECSYVHRTGNYYNLENIISNSNTLIKEGHDSFFAELEQRFGNISTILGMRYEHVNSCYYESGVKMPEQCRRYDNLFPSATLVFPLGKTTVQLGYSRKTVRPLYLQLSSAVVYINRYTYESGNPLLQPAYKNDITLNLRYNWLMGMFDYTHVNGSIISTYTQYKDDPTISLLRKDNARALDKIQAIAVISPSFGFYHPVLMGGAVMQYFHVEYMGEDKSMDRPMGIIRFNNTLSLPSDMLVNADFSWRSKGDSENMRIGSTWQLDWGVSKSFCKNWNVKLSCEDIFNTASAVDARIYSGYRQFHINKKTTTRCMEFTVRYNFNTSKSKYKGTSAGKDEKDRLN